MTVATEPMLRRPLLYSSVQPSATNQTSTFGAGQSLTPLPSCMELSRIQVILRTSSTLDG